MVNVNNINIDKYVNGKGIEVNEEHILLNSEHKYIEPDNLYMLRNEVGIEHYDYLYSHNFINKTKYYRILLYEWFHVIKEGGYLIIEFEDNEITNLYSLKQEINNLVLYKDRYKIIENSLKGKNNTIIIQKTASIAKDANEINHWTFGIVTNGKRKELIEKAIHSIRRLNIPYHEIIICGTYHGEINDDIKYMHFTEKDNKGWITKKKNLICENAKYENIVIIHDRICFDKDWFRGMKRYGNYFDVLSCPVIFPKKSKAQFTNWEAVSTNWKREDEYRLLHSNVGLDHSDWDFAVYVGGPLIIIKKSIWKYEKWNEALFWGEAEDIEYSLRQHKNGVMIRFNPYSKVYALTFSGIIFNYKAYYIKNSRKLGALYLEQPLPLVFFSLKMLDLLGLRRNQKFVQFFLKQIKKIWDASNWKEEKE